MKSDSLTTDPRVWIKELAEAGWKQHGLTLWQAPCGCYFRGPYRAWVEMNGTHVADHVAYHKDAS